MKTDIPTINNKEHQSIWRKIAYTLFISSFIISTASAQVVINEDDAAGDANAELDVQSTTKGVIFPVMTEVERDAIKSPVAGLLIFNRTGGYHNYYDGTNWQQIDRVLDAAATNPSAGTGTDVGVGVGVADPDNSAILHVNSTIKGFLLPRPSSSPAATTGLMYYASGQNTLVYYNGTDWSEPTTTASVVGAGGAETAAGVLIGTGTIEATAKMEIKTTTKGLLIPRMTDAQRDVIDTPLDGLTIYNTDDNEIEYYLGGSWYEWANSVIPLGSAQSNPGESCQDIYINNVPSNGVDGIYWIDTDGVGGNAEFECYCDMTTDNGGWTLVVSRNNTSASMGAMFRTGSANRDAAAGNVTTDVTAGGATWWTDMRWGPATARTSSFASIPFPTYNLNTAGLIDWFNALGTGVAPFSPATSHKCTWGSAYVAYAGWAGNYNSGFPVNSWNLPSSTGVPGNWSGYAPTMNTSGGANCYLMDTRGFNGFSDCHPDTRQSFIQAWVR